MIFELNIKKADRFCQTERINHFKKKDNIYDTMVNLLYD